MLYFFLPPPVSPAGWKGQSYWNQATFGRTSSIQEGTLTIVWSFYWLQFPLKQFKLNFSSVISPITHDVRGFDNFDLKNAKIVKILYGRRSRSRVQEAGPTEQENFTHILHK